MFNPKDLINTKLTPEQKKRYKYYVKKRLQVDFVAGLQELMLDITDLENNTKDSKKDADKEFILTKEGQS